jgi:E2F/DP family winged-helix DNA-binding domain
MRETFRSERLKEKAKKEIVNEDEEESKYKKDKSLGILCSQFIGLFVTWKRVISLEEAAREISQKDIEDQKLKTKIRRLYDIANVL